MWRGEKVVRLYIGLLGQGGSVRWIGDVERKQGSEASGRVVRVEKTGSLGTWGEGSDGSSC